MKLRHLIFFLITGLGVLAVPPASAASEPLNIEKALKSRSLCPFVEYREDPAGALGIDDVRGGKSVAEEWKKLGKKTLGFGFSASVYWVRFEIANPGEKDADILIQQEYPLIDSIEMWVYADGRPAEHYTTGDTLLFKQRPIIHRTYLFPVTVRAESSSTVYLRYKSQNPP